MVIPFTGNVKSDVPSSVHNCYNSFGDLGISSRKRIVPDGSHTYIVYVSAHQMARAPVKLNGL
ncbi:hypothetical protein M378DRAFT_171280, partial [Amanita muscaria Koide BX008]